MAAKHTQGSLSLLSLRSAARVNAGDARPGEGRGKGFGSSGPTGRRRRAGSAARPAPAAAADGSAASTSGKETSRSRGRRRKGTGLSAADHGPLGRSPDLEAIRARSRLGLPLAGRLREQDVSQAWKRAAAEHHPDRGGRHDTMQAVNGARDVLLGRGLA